MCANVGLFTRIRRAKEDIVCYKILEQDLNDICMFHPTLCNQGFVYRLGEISYSGVLLRKKFTCCRLVIKEGLHSLCYKQDVEELASVFRFPHTVVAKCVIPKGTRYIKGTCGAYNYDCYVAEDLMVEEVLYKIRD